MATVYALNLAQRKDKFDKNQIRKGEQEKQYRYYSGDFWNMQKYLQQALQLTYDTDDISEMQLQVINITDKLINQMSVVYLQPPKRIITVNDTENEELTKYYSTIMPYNLNNSDKEALRLAKLHNTSITHVMFSNVRTQVKYKIVPSYMYDVKVEGDKVVEVSYPKYIWNESKEQDECFTVYWTEDELFMRDEMGNRHKLPNKDDTENPWIDNEGKGVIPFPYMKLRNSIDFWGEGQNDLVNVNEQVNLLLTKLVNSDIILGTEGTTLAVNLDLVKKGTEEQGLKKVRTGRKHPLTVENVRSDMVPPSLSHVTTDPRIDEIKGFIDWQIKYIANLKGLNPSTILSEVKDTSDYQKLMDAVGQMEIRKDDIEPCRAYEKDRFEITKVINNNLVNTEQGQGLQLIPWDAELKVDFAEIEVHKTPEDIRQQRDWEFKHGLSTPVDWAMEDNPEITKEEAETLIAANRGLNLTRFSSLLTNQGTE